MKTVFLAMTAILIACQPVSIPSSPDELVSRGRAVYQANCTSCHAADPSKIGPMGPPVVGASPRLLKSRLLWATYPPDYLPQRTTRLMPAMPFLAKDIDALAAYLASQKKSVSP